MSMFKSYHTGDSWATPKDLYNKLNEEFSFNCDPCPLNDHPTIDGLSLDWGTSTYVNPPYSKPTPWIQKAIEESKKGNTVVMLLRGDTSTKWFHDLVFPNADEVRYLKGRLKFGNKGPAPFASIVVVFRGKEKNTTTRSVETEK